MEPGEPDVRAERAYVHILESALAESQRRECAYWDTLNKVNRTLLANKLAACCACAKVDYYNDFYFAYCMICDDPSKAMNYCSDCTNIHVDICDHCDGCIIKNHNHVKMSACPECGTSFT